MIEREFSKRSQREVLMWPNLGHVENIPPVLFCLLGAHDLNISSPAWEVSLLDVFKKVLYVVIGIFTCNLRSFGVCEVLDSLVRFKMDLDIVERSILNLISCKLQPEL